MNLNEFKVCFLWFDLYPTLDETYDFYYLTNKDSFNLIICVRADSVIDLQGIYQVKAKFWRFEHDPCPDFQMFCEHDFHPLFFKPNGQG